MALNLSIKTTQADGFLSLIFNILIFYLFFILFIFFILYLIFFILFFNLIFFCKKDKIYSWSYWLYCKEYRVHRDFKESDPIKIKNWFPPKMDKTYVIEMVLDMDNGTLRFLVFNLF